MQRAERYMGKQPITQGDKTSKLQQEMRRKAMDTLKKDYEETFNGKASPEVAQRVLFDMLSYCMLNQIVMTGNSWTYFNDGKRDVGLRTKALVGPDLRATYERQMEVVVK